MKKFRIIYVICLLGFLSACVGGVGEVNTDGYIRFRTMDNTKTYG
jgi:hypothetical protein